MVFCPRRDPLVEVEGTDSSKDENVSKKNKLIGLI